MLYLDNAATSYEKPRLFYRVMHEYTKSFSVNAGRGGHKYSIDGARGIEETAEELCGLFGIGSSDRIAFSQNATMSLNQAIFGILKNGGHAIVTQMEHNSVLRPVNCLKNYTIVKADIWGYVDEKEIEKAIRRDTKLIISTHASNVCGTIEPIEKIGIIARKNNIPFLVDAAQTAGCCKIDVEKMNIDMLAFSAHKGLMGPLGVGGLYVREGIELEPILLGGTGSFSKDLKQPNIMPDLLQIGTQNTPAIMALGESVKYIKRITPEVIGARQRELAYMLIERLENIEGVSVYGKKTRAEGERNGTVLFNIDGIDSGTVSEILNDEYRIAVRGGWHCAYEAHRAIGSEKSGGVRASFGFFSNENGVRRLADAVYEISKKKYQ